MNSIERGIRQINEAHGLTSPEPRWRRRLRKYWENFSDEIRYSYIVRKTSDVKYALRNMIFRGHNNVRLRKFSGKDWVETDVRLFEATFELLREFVEVQVAWMEVMCHSEKYSRITYWKIKYFSRGFSKLRRELALRYLDWEINETDEPAIVVGSQAYYAQKTKDLYLWYMDVYDKVPDPFDIPCPDRDEQVVPTHFDADGDPLLFKWVRGTGPEWEAYYDAISKAADEEQRRYDEATEKAIEVLRIRQGLWT